MTTKTTTHKQEIETTRKGGFGGSDAKMVYKVGLKGLSALSNTDKIRIRVAKGIDEYKSVPMNSAMQKGHDFEDWYEKQSFAPLGAEREAKIIGDMAMNFKTFAHADFLSDGEVWELKCLSKPEMAYKDYAEQLQWYHMLGATNVWLVVTDSAEPFETGIKMPISVARDENVIKVLRNGIKLLDENWNSLDLEVGEDWSDSDLMPFERADIQMMTDYLQEIKALEEVANDMKARVFEFMQNNNIKSLKSDSYLVTYVQEGTTSTLDKKKLFSEHPEINESDFLKTSKKKAYITVKLI